MIEFWVKCNPPKGTYQSGRTIMRSATGTPFVGRTKKGRELTDTWFSILFPYAPQQPLEGPLSLKIKYAYPFRKSEPKHRKALGWVWCDQKPDADNLVKQIQDVMQRLCFFDDDKQIALLQVEKIWSDSPGVGITLEELDQ